LDSKNALFLNGFFHFIIFNLLFSNRVGRPDFQQQPVTSTPQNGQMSAVPTSLIIPQVHASPIIDVDIRRKV